MNMIVGIYIKDLLLVWKYHDTYCKVIIFLGPFHTKINYIGMLTNSGLVW